MAAVVLMQLAGAGAAGAGPDPAQFPFPYNWTRFPAAWFAGNRGFRI